MAASAKSTQISEHEKNLVIVAAKLSNVLLKDIARRANIKPDQVQRLVKKYGNEAEKFRQKLRADNGLMRIYSFDRMFPGTARDISVDDAMALQSSPTFPKARLGARKARRKHPKRTMAERFRRITEKATAIPIQADLKGQPIQRASIEEHNKQHSKREIENALEKAALACATYVLDRLKK